AGDGARFGREAQVVDGPDSPVVLRQVGDDDGPGPIAVGPHPFVEARSGGQHHCEAQLSIGGEISAPPSAAVMVTPRVASRSRIERPGTPPAGPNVTGSRAAGPRARSAGPQKVLRP